MFGVEVWLMKLEPKCQSIALTSGKRRLDFFHEHSTIYL